MRISGAALLDVKFGKKYTVVQTVTGDTCEIAITTDQQSKGFRVRQDISNNRCELKFKEVEV